MTGELMRGNYVKTLKDHDWTEDFVRFVDEGFNLEMDIWRFMQECKSEAYDMGAGAEEYNELAMFAYGHKPYKYFRLKDNYGGMVIPACYEYAWWLTEYAEGTEIGAKKAGEYCLRYDPSGIGELMKSILDGYAYSFMKDAKNAATMLSHIRTECEEAMPLNLYKRLTALDEEFSKYKEEI